MKWNGEGKEFIGFGLVKVMQINKREGVFVNWGGLGVSLGHLAGYDDERGVGISWKRYFGREAFNEERERMIK